MTAIPQEDLLPLPDIEQYVYERTRRFLDSDVIVAVGQLLDAHAAQAILADRARLKPLVLRLVRPWRYSEAEGLFDG